MRCEVIVLALAAASPSFGLPSLKPINSAETCGGCHRSILEAWKESSHARAADGRLFQDALEAAETAIGATARRTCLGCHAPLAVQTGDLQLDRKVSWEGVTCDYCHSVRKVTLGPGNPQARLEFANVKSGPIKGAASGVLGTVYSEVHESSRLCAACHEYRNGQGFAVLTTFSEWQASRYAKENKNCQSCHMYQVTGDVVDARLARAPQSQINLHRMPGSRSVTQLNRTIKASMASVREGDQLKVTVELTNSASGHFVPTGSPLRQLILDVQAESQGANQIQTRLYTRKIVDAAGVPITREYLAFLKAAKTTSDTRLAPDEKRTEEFRFKLAPGAAADVRATLSYFYSPGEREASQRRITIRTLVARIK